MTTTDTKERPGLYPVYNREGELVTVRWVKPDDEPDEPRKHRPDPLSGIALGVCLGLIFWAFVIVLCLAAR